MIHESYTMLTINADRHPLMSRMHKPDPEPPADHQDKRSVIPIEPEDWDERLAALAQRCAGRNPIDRDADHGRTGQEIELCGHRSQAHVTTTGLPPSTHTGGDAVGAKHPLLRDACSQRSHFFPRRADGRGA